MRRQFCGVCAATLLVLVYSVSMAQESVERSGAAAQQSAPTLEEVTRPSTQVPSETAPDALAAQPSRLVYVGSEGSFLLNPQRSRGIFRWSGQHWANSISFVFEDANYWMYRLDGSNGWFAFAKNPSGGNFVIWKGLGASSNSITWQDQPNGWMRASRGAAVGNLN
jgi:hypothetical protein